MIFCLTDRDVYQLGSLSHYIFAKAYGYNELPDFPEVEPDPSVRNVEIANDWGPSSGSSGTSKKRLANKPFYAAESSSEDEGTISFCLYGLCASIIP